MSDYLKEETLSKNYLYRGKIINVRQDRVKVHGGEEAFREVVEHPGAVAVLTMTEKDEVVLVKQYRQAVEEIMLEIPAGKLEPNEGPLECACRELLEETGLTAEKWNQICAFYPSPGFCDEIIYLFVARELSHAVSPTTDPEERIAVFNVPFKEAASMIASGQIKDGKTIIALQFALLQRF